MLDLNSIQDHIPEFAVLAGTALCTLYGVARIFLKPSPAACAAPDPPAPPSSYLALTVLHYARHVKTPLVRLLRSDGNNRYYTFSGASCLDFCVTPFNFLRVIYRGCDVTSDFTGDDLAKIHLALCEKMDRADEYHVNNVVANIHDNYKGIV